MRAAEGGASASRFRCRRSSPAGALRGGRGWGGGGERIRVSAGGADHPVRRDPGAVQAGEEEQDASSGRVRLPFPRSVSPIGVGRAQAPAEDREAQSVEAALAGDRSYPSASAAGRRGTLSGRAAACSPRGVRGLVHRAAGRAGRVGGGAVFARALIALIRFYQRGISPFFPSSCRFHPSCSAYGSEAIRRHGAWRGGWLTLKRLGRCHPFGRGGYDPVP